MFFALQDSNDGLAQGISLTFYPFRQRTYRIITSWFKSLSKAMVYHKLEQQFLKMNQFKNFKPDL